MPKVTKKPDVYEARQIDHDDKESDWILVNTNDPSDVVHVNNDQYKARYQRSRANVDPIPGFQPDNENTNQNEAAGANSVPVTDAVVGDTNTGHSV